MRIVGIAKWARAKMGPHVSLRLFVASALSLALSNQVLAEDAPAPPASAPTSVSADVKIGDQWAYKYHTNLNDRKSGTTTYVVEDVGPNKIETDSRTHSSAGGPDSVVNYVYDRCWRAIQGPRGKVVNADAMSGPIPSITVGQDWTTDIYWQPLNSSLRFKWTEHGHVAAWESVKLADGQKYDAFKITYRRESTPSEGTGIQVVTAGETTQKLVERTVEWYAPAVNRYVKRTFEASRDGTIYQSFSEELTSYTRGD